MGTHDRSAAMSLCAKSTMTSSVTGMRSSLSHSTMMPSGAALRLHGCPRHRSGWRNCLENRNESRIRSPKASRRGRSGVDQAPLGGKNARSRGLRHFSKQFRKGDSPKSLSGMMNKVGARSTFGTVSLTSGKIPRPHNVGALHKVVRSRTGSRPPAPPYRVHEPTTPP